MEALRLEWAGGAPAPRLRTSEAMTRQGLVTTVFSRAGTAAVVGWVGSARDRAAGARGLLDDSGRQGAAPPVPAGDYAAVLVYRDRILLMRDEQARVPLFFRECGGRVSAVSTSVRCLGSVTELAPRYFCRYLTGNLAQPHSDLTPFAGVHRVLGGEVVELSPTGQLRSRTLRRPRRATDPPERTTDGSCLDGAAQELRRALENAVGRRMGTTTACHVSGGTDSTSVALLAARLLAAERGGAGDLVLLAGRFSRGELAAEQPYLDVAMEEIRRHTPAVRPMIIDADDVADFDDFQHHAGDSDEPHAHAFRAPFWARLHAAAAELGCDTLLTGCGADPIADANPFHLHRLARTGALRQMTEQARAWAAESEQGLRDIVRAYVVQPAFPLAAERLTALRGGGTVLGGLGTFNRPRWLRSGFARAHGYRDAGIAESRFMFGRKPERSLYDAANYVAAPDLLSWQRARRDGFFLSHPFLDAEVVATMSRLPAAATFRPGRPKAVLRAAMADLLPAPIHGRVVKVPFNDLYARGLRRHGDELIALCRSARHPLIAEMFDVETLCRAVREAQLGLGDSYSWDRVNSSLALVAWLERLDRRSGALGAAVPVSAGS
ncbi:asparagine synthase (glutamine-hydrolysing) [Streptomyces sp. KS_16]|nr:asparagine synthase (glutamine-hydrolysing) [Streptomyces sp. 2321.6]SDR58178.1 asparagine synthase (glutamine-hydrolysing) [Streptomyces sp. KS_16]SEB78736.1 asparagine synthase (glutamine-hydrolysing) [Streptomyces sp. 2133.1]SNC60933.1 asparagine synthase (glutamine-hydrolysing) [Streptomyces sp. 2114.4]